MVSSCQVGTITLLKTMRQKGRGLVQGTACSPEIINDVEKNQEQELANDYHHVF